MTASPESGTNLLQFNESNFEVEVLQSDKPVLVDFWADWCRPCHMVAPIIEKLAGDHAGMLAVGKLNVDEAREIASKFEIRSIPTVMLFKQGQVVETLIGVQPPQAYEDAIRRHVASA
jgi:thioredoxin 1